MASAFGDHGPWMRRKHVRWSDIEDIWVHDTRHLGNVVWSLKQPGNSPDWIMGGFDGSLPDMFAFPAEVIAHELKRAMDEAETPAARP
ncbi:hypothetical protein [Croceicoccus mobilis]|nr:hypothetical protein [Croceicoccus mobilis]